MAISQLLFDISFHEKKAKGIGLGSNWMLSPVFYSGMSSLQEKEILSGCFKKNKILKIKIQKSIAETLTGALQSITPAPAAGGEGQTPGARTPRTRQGLCPPHPGLQGLSFPSPVSPEEPPVCLRPPVHDHSFAAERVAFSCDNLARGPPWASPRGRQCRTAGRESGCEACRAGGRVEWGAWAADPPDVPKPWAQAYSVSLRK